jgi:hypothetical protein
VCVCVHTHIHTLTHAMRAHGVPHDTRTHPCMSL